MLVRCIKTTKGSWLKIGTTLLVIKEDMYGRYYFSNGGLAHKSLFEKVTSEKNDLT